MKISKKKETRSRIFTRCRLLSCIIYMLCIFVFTYEAKADEEIPEAAFGSVEVYNYILEIADANSDGILTKAEAEEVTEIDLQNKNITSG